MLTSNIYIPGLRNVLINLILLSGFSSAQVSENKLARAETTTVTPLEPSAVWEDNDPSKSQIVAVAYPSSANENFVLGLEGWEEGRLLFILPSPPIFLVSAPSSSVEFVGCTTRQVAAIFQTNYH